MGAMAAALGTVAVNTAASFFVPIGISSGVSQATAGDLLTLASFVAIFVRLIAGTAADRLPGANPYTVAIMMLVGGLGLAITALGTPQAFIIGATLTVAGGWGWTGLLLASTIRLLPGNAAKGWRGHAARPVRGCSCRPDPVRYPHHRPLAARDDIRGIGLGMRRRHRCRHRQRQASTQPRATHHPPVGANDRIVATGRTISRTEMVLTRHVPQADGEFRRSSQRRVIRGPTVGVASLGRV